MQAARRFGALDCVDKFHPSALVELSRNRVPEAAIEKAVEKARSGQLVTKIEAVQFAKQFHAGPAPRPVTSAARRQSPDRSGDGFAPPSAASVHAALEAPPARPTVEAVERAVETLRQSVATLLPNLSQQQAAALADRLLDLAFRLRSVGTGAAAPRLDPERPDQPGTAVPAKKPTPRTPQRGRKAG